MYSLIYLSVATKVMQHEDLVEILNYSRSWNKDHDLTGCLAYIEGKTAQKHYCKFVQVLEGPEHEIVSLFKNIKKDSRHTEVTIIKQGFTENRNFSGWEMGFEKIKLNSNSTLQKFFELDPKVIALDGDINNNMLLDFMKSFYYNL